VRQCGFREAVAFLATLAGVGLEQDKFSRADAERFAGGLRKAGVPE